MTIVTLGIDLAKNVFALHGVNDAGKPELARSTVARAKLSEVVAALPPCLIGMEACSGAHHWARQFVTFGHTVKLMAPKFVAPYRLSGKRGKNDAADAAAICEAVQRPNMRFVPVKSLEQQSQLMVHRARQGFVEQRTATINRIRGLLSEFGIVLPLKAAVVRREAAKHLEELPGWGNAVIGDLLSELHRLDERIAQYDAHLRTIAKQSTPAKQLMRLGGIGETTATAIVAMVGNGHEFTSGRQFAAWIGLVPGRYSSGGKARLGHITKAGDAYLRSLLVMGARAVLAAAASKTDSVSRWAVELAERRGYWCAVARGGGDGGKERTHGVGRARQGRGVRTAGVRRREIDMKPVRRPTHPPALPASEKGASALKPPGLQAAECASRNPGARLRSRRRRQARAAFGAGLRPGLTAPPRPLRILPRSASPH